MERHRAMPRVTNFSHQGHDSSSSIIIGREHAGVDVDNKCVERFSQSSESGGSPLL